MEIAHTVSKRATCNRGRSGCVIARDRQILVTGYVGSPIGLPHCDDAGHQMKKTLAILICGMLLFPLTVFAQQDHAVLGYWFSADEDEPLNDGIIEVYQKGDRFFGRIVWSRRDNPIDVEGDGRPLMDRDILMDFRHAGGNRYGSGRIYNPRNGRTYSCTLEVLDGGKRLRVRGYVGISLFGRTEFWTRVSDISEYSKE